MNILYNTKKESIDNKINNYNNNILIEDNSIKYLYLSNTQKIIINKLKYEDLTKQRIFIKYFNGENFVSIEDDMFDTSGGIVEKQIGSITNIPYNIEYENINENNSYLWHNYDSEYKKYEIIFNKSYDIILEIKTLENSNNKLHLIFEFNSENNNIPEYKIWKLKDDISCNKIKFPSTLNDNDFKEKSYNNFKENLQNKYEIKISLKEEGECYNNITSYSSWIGMYNKYYKDLYINYNKKIFDDHIVDVILEQINTNNSNIIKF